MVDNLHDIAHNDNKHHANMHRILAGQTERERERMWIKPIQSKTTEAGNWTSVTVIIIAS